MHALLTHYQSDLSKSGISLLCWTFTEKELIWQCLVCLVEIICLCLPCSGQDFASILQLVHNLIHEEEEEEDQSSQQ